MTPLMWQYVGIFSAALAAVLLVLLLWKRREDRRYRAVELADTLALWGFDRLAKLLRAYAVGNYFGANSVGRVTREIVDDMRSGGLPTMLRSIGWKVVEGVFLKNSDDRAKLMELLTTTTPATEIKPPAPTL